MAKRAIKNTISLTDVANVIDILNILNVRECVHLAEWEASIGHISAAHQEILEEVREELLLNRNQWNEEELKMNFVSAVMRASKLNVPNEIKVFYERPLTGSVQGYNFSIICDCMVATPTQGGRPKAPYFFLQEFKKGKGDGLDAEAQVLVAMLLAQLQNNDQKPLYGAWLIGENWCFTVLNGNEYCISESLKGTDPKDLQKIVFMIQHLKTIIRDR
jgi:hypothetical protein